MKHRVLNILLVMALMLALSTAVYAQDGGFTPEPLSPSESFSADAAKEKASVAADAFVDVSGLEAVSIIVTFDKSFDPRALEAASGGEVVHRYTKIFNGASVVLAGDKVNDVASLQGVTGVYLDTLLQPDTEVSPGFIGAPVAWEALGGQESAGEGTIVGVLDTGVWPEHPSFSDPDPSGKPYDAPPVMPGSNGFGSAGLKDTCDFGDAAYNPNDAAFTCNNKLIGAYDFLDTYKVVRGLLPEEFDSARDADGHGTHTMSTAAGNGGVAASIFGVDRGIISGIAPRAHVIMYKVCGDAGCYSSDSAAAVEQAILDEVDSINFSISGGSSPYSDVVSLAFLSAYENGVFVAASSGNSGPGADTTAHREPWTTTVGASTSNRHFLSTVTLEADNGDTLELLGATVTDGISTPTPVIFPPAGEEMCNSPFPAGTFNGEIVICRRGVIARVEKSYNVAAGGAGGLLLYNPVNQGLNTDNHFIPSIHLDGDDGVVLLDFMAAHTGVMGTFTMGEATTVQGDIMASFSSRGGPLQTLGVSKPDITAPGVQILAGHTPLPATPVGGLPGELFQAIQGTSMSSPHIAGSAALVKALHPDWTPGQVKSALMMTALTEGVTKEDGMTPADAFDYGSGRVDLSKAGDPSMTISDSGASFVDHEEDLWNSNYPSLYVPVMPGRITVERTLHSEFSKFTCYTTEVEAPADVYVAVSHVICIPPGGDKTIEITVDARHVPDGEVRFATLFFQRGAKESLHFPITIVRREPAITLDKACEPAVFPLYGSTSCSISMTNTTFDDAMVHMEDVMPYQLRIVHESVVGGVREGGYKLSFDGVLEGAAPPLVTVVDGTGTSPAGYLPLALFGIAPNSMNGDEQCLNYNVPEYMYAGEVYSRVGMVSNGYLVVGGCTGNADIQYINQVLPNPALPNNVLAPFWTDLNPSAGGEYRVGILTDGVNDWVIFDWQDAPNWSDHAPNSFQVWIGLNGVEDISFTFGDVTEGDGGFLTVGAENAYGSSGDNYYANGVGTLPVLGAEVRVQSVPGEPGETHTVEFEAFSKFVGEWTNCAMLTSDAFDGTNIACFSGEVTP